MGWKRVKGTEVAKQLFNRSYGLRHRLSLRAGKYEMSCGVGDKVSNQLWHLATIRAVWTPENKSFHFPTFPRKLSDVRNGETTVSEFLFWEGTQPRDPRAIV